MSIQESKFNNRAASYKRKNRVNTFKDFLRQVIYYKRFLFVIFWNILITSISFLQSYRQIMKDKREFLVERVRNIAYEMQKKEVTYFIDKTCTK